MENTQIIECNTWYLISDVVKHGWITTRRGRTDRQYIYELIKGNKLKAHNVIFGNTKATYYKILGKDIIDYLAKFS
jgi:hypothetical protein